MSLNLHPEARARLVELLAEALKHVQVEHNEFPAVESLELVLQLDRALPEHDALHEALVSYISDRPLADFVNSELATELAKRNYDAHAPTLRLTTLDEYADATTAAERLISRFEQLPFHYAVFVALSPDLSSSLIPFLGTEGFSISERICLVRGSEASRSFPPGTSPRPRGLLLPQEVGLHSNLVYLRQDVDGYIASRYRTTPVDDYTFFLRAILGCLFATNLLRPNVHWSFFTGERSSLAYKEAVTGWELVAEEEFDIDTSRCITRMGLNPRLAGFPGEVVTELVNDGLSKCQSAFANLQDNETLLLACQWLFDSYSSGSALQAFVQATIAIEILLGDKASSDLIGLGELLANRCAYLLGTSRQERAEILQKFRRLYSTRSKIVHRGKNRLNHDESGDLVELSYLAASVIRKELRLAQADGREARIGE